MTGQWPGGPANHIQSLWKQCNTGNWSSDDRQNKTALMTIKVCQSIGEQSGLSQMATEYTSVYVCIWYMYMYKHILNMKYVYVDYVMLYLCYV